MEVSLFIFNFNFFLYILLDWPINIGSRATQKKLATDRVRHVIRTDPGESRRAIWTFFFLFFRHAIRMQPLVVPGVQRAAVLRRVTRCVSIQSIETLINKHQFDG